MKLIIKKHPKTSHKGQNGEVLIIGGSKDYVGCLALAGLAALRTGVDWVTIAAPEKVGWAINALKPDLVVKKYKGDSFCASRAKDILKLEKKFDAVLIGNGIGVHAKTFVKKYIRESKKPLVIDADAIKVISLGEIDNAILTPHKKELELLLKNSKKDFINKLKGKKKIKALQKIIKNNILLIKGHVDIIVSKDKVAYNRTGNEGMTKGGTGDVLAGLVVGFIAQHYDRFRAAQYAAYINGKVGDKLKKKKGYSFIASDLVEDMKKVL